MINYFNIDLPFLCARHEVGYNQYDLSLLLSVMESIDEFSGSCLVFNGDVYDLMDLGDSEVSSFIFYRLSLIQTLPYKRHQQHISSTPVLTDDNLPPEINDEILSQLTAIHNQARQQHTVTFVAERKRVDPDVQHLATTKDEEEQQHEICHVADDDSVRGFMQGKLPVLRQLKHTDSQRNFGEEMVSRFSAWNERDERKAKALLLKAYNDCKEEAGEWPKYLFTWDSESNTYVEFRNSLNNEYHGFDVTTERERQRIPDYIKQKYHK